jgi:tetratricopeptide (TPR) repeat protein
LLLLGLFVAALAFLLASFPARTSDLWLHLAAGKQLAGPDHSFAPAPGFPADLGINQTWIYNLVCYGLYATLGGTGLVLAKALLVAGLALVLLRLGRVDHGWGIATACTALALLAMSTRLLLQPATVSCLLLALTLLCLWQSDGKVTRAGPLLVLFAVWTGVDRWFVVGLGTVALVWIGQAIDSGVTKEGGRTGLVGRLVLFVLLVAVCLLNPVFLLHPADFHPRMLLPAAQSAFHAWGQVTSPFQEAYLTSPAGLTPAGLAYFPLLILGGLSFAANLPRWPWERFLPWLALALLSAFQVRAIPFFAVVAGPVLARNLQDALAHRLAGNRETLLAMSRAGHGLTFLLGLVLLVCAWPGWLQPPPYGPRRWAVEPAPSLERGAAAVRRWHEEGKLAAGSRTLHLSLSAACAFAWFCPQDSGLLDDELAAAIRGEKSAPPDWAERLRSAGVDRVVLYDPDRGRLFATLERLLTDPEHWPLLSVEGDLAVFGWRDPARPGAAGLFRSLPLDLNERAFRPGETDRAPRQGPDRAPEERLWWEAFWKPAPGQRIDRDQATLYLFHAEALRHGAPVRHYVAWTGSQSAGLVGAAGGWTAPGGLLDASMRLVLLRPQEPQEGSGRESLPPLDQLAYVFRERFNWLRDDTSPALLYLAVRAARRAVAASPDDAQAYVVLGEAYLRLHYHTSERAWGRHLPELVQLRHSQAAAALNQAVTLKPDHAQAHRDLGGLYRQMGYLDLALAHLQTYVQLVHKGGATPEGNAAEQLRFEQDVDRLAKQVKRRENEYVAVAQGLNVLDRAILAMRKQLAGKARDMLLESHLAAFGPRGMDLELRLLLATGRPRDVRDWLGPEHQPILGVPTYHWLRAQAQAALGEYALASEECSALGRSLTPGESGREGIGLRERLALLVGQALLDGPASEGGMTSLMRRTVSRVDFPKRVRGLAQNLKREADVKVLQGMLALEQGDVGEAEAAFREALALWGSPAAAASGRGLDFNGRLAAQSCLEWLQ